NPSLRVTGIVLTLYEANTRLAQEVIQDLQEYLDRSRGGNAPWAKARIFGTRIRRNVKLAECPSFGRSIFGYWPQCNGAEDYAARAGGGLGEPPVGLPARVELDERGQASVMSVQTTSAPAPAEDEAAMQR